jgi:hypothetical protein
MPLFARGKKGKKEQIAGEGNPRYPCAPAPICGVDKLEGEHGGVPAALAPDLSSGTMRERRAARLLPVRFSISVTLSPLFFCFWIRDGAGAAEELGLDWGGRKGEHTSVTGQSQPLDQL